jgi:L,D-transpeptidase-like protein
MDREKIIPMKCIAIAVLALFTLTFQAFAQDTPGDNLVFEPEACAYAHGEATSDACLTLMTEHSRPEFNHVEEDRNTLGSYSFWKVGPNAVNEFDAPNGNVVGQIPSGFNFVSATDTSLENWLQIQGGKWIPRDNTRYVEPSSFTGVLLPDDWTQPFAWILDKTGIYASFHPGEPGSADSGYVTRRYDMVNIFAEAIDADGWTWYMIGPNQWLKQTFVARVKPAPKPDGVSGRWVAVDLYEQTLVAYEEDKPVFATLVASGLDGFDTQEGLFTIWARLPSDGMSGATGAPSAYALQSVPWVMYFNGSTSLHGTYWHDLFGYRRSHGCVNLSISDSRWLFDWTAASPPDENGQIVNYVYVFSSGEYGVPSGKP